MSHVKRGLGLRLTRVRVSAALVAAVFGACAYASGLTGSLAPPQWQLVGADDDGVKVLTSKQPRPRLLKRTAGSDPPAWSYADREEAERDQ